MSQWLLVPNDGRGGPVDTILHEVTNVDSSKAPVATKQMPV